MNGTAEWRGVRESNSGSIGSLPFSMEAKPRARVRTAVVATPERTLRVRMADALRRSRWQVEEAEGAAALFEAASRFGEGGPAAILVDSWLPDLDIRECVVELVGMYPEADVLALDGTELGAPAPKGAHRGELLHVLHRASAVGEDGAAWTSAPLASELSRQGVRAAAPAVKQAEPSCLPEFLGEDARMLEVSRRIQLVAPRRTAVLVQGPTGTGKELVARALHRLSPRAHKPFVTINCAAIPEALLEAELFGHTRGAFTGAVQGRVGRLEAAHGGTLFLDEIGELPLALQAKLLRFAECGELQRMGDNEPVRVDVRIVAATHRGLRKMAEAGQFRLDLYYRLSVFLIETPALGGRAADIGILATETLARLGALAGEAPKRLSPEALALLCAYSWPGNVRELQHTLERAVILAEDRLSLEACDIDFGTDGGHLPA